MTTTDMPQGHIAQKVKGATAGAGAGSVLTGLVLWLLDDYVFDPDVAGSVPEPLSAAVLFFIPTLAALAGGYFTRRSSDELAPVDDDDHDEDAVAPDPTGRADVHEQDDADEGELGPEDYGFEDGPAQVDPGPAGYAQERRLMDPLPEPQDADHEDDPRD